MEITHAEQRRKARRMRKQRGYQRAYRERLKEAQAAMSHEEMRIGGLTRAEWNVVFELDGKSLSAEDREVTLDRMFDGTHPAQS